MTSDLLRTRGDGLRASLTPDTAGAGCALGFQVGHLPDVHQLLECRDDGAAGRRLVGGRLAGNDRAADGGVQLSGQLVALQ